ncbi:hypothetical protein LUZ60_007466 [Juncus effusus]|nr:hypothetical protein LUZ60_007466 [Juncus effusus]
MNHDVHTETIPFHFFPAFPLKRFSLFLSSPFRNALRSSSSLLFSSLRSSSAMSTSAPNNEPKPPVMGYPAPPPSATAGGGVPTSAAAYPYPAPPPHSIPSYYYTSNPNPNPNSYPPPNHNPNPYPYSYPNPNPNPYYSSSRNALFLRRLLILCISFIIAVGAISMIIWLALRPHFPAFSISSASLSNLNVSNSNSLSMDLTLTLTAQNPNRKLSISYSTLSTDVSYQDETLAQTTLSPFFQAKQNTTEINVRFVAVQEYISADVAKGIGSEKGKGNGSVHFQIRVYSWVVFNSGIWRTRRHMLRVLCDDVAIGFNKSSGNLGGLLNGVKQCTVSM